MASQRRNRSLDKVIRREEVRDSRGNFLGYVENCRDGLFNHYDKDGVFIASTTTKWFDYRKCEREK